MFVVVDGKKSEKASTKLSCPTYDATLESVPGKARPVGADYSLVNCSKRPIWWYDVTSKFPGGADYGD